MIGVFGGTGFYGLLNNSREVVVETPYGAPSAPFTVGTVAGIDVAFLPRHGQDHQFPPHKIPYRANAWAMKELGVDKIIGPCAAGSLTAALEPGHLVVTDQLVDRTHGRDSTFFDGPDVAHISFADPFCSELRPLAVEGCRSVGATVHDGGTNVIIQGPRFSTRAESRWYARSGFEVINMTQIPEVPLARELEMCYVNIAVITDYDVGVEGHEHEVVTHQTVMELFAETLDTLKKAVLSLIPMAAATPRACECATAMSGAAG
ncbi:MAG: S-methyl-5'-thioadenosine phosphorylase [Acidimicrobiia bacterium]|nr:S-methyl-5'-thioadenosine phosphorylase [Acidimicrobiia bacterium]